MQLANMEAWEQPYWVEWILVDDYGDVVGVMPDYAEAPPLCYVTHVYPIRPERAIWLIGMATRAE